MSLVKLLSFETIGCGCVIGRYREIATGRQLAYVEEKGAGCSVHAHRRNHAVAVTPAPSSQAVQFGRKAS